MLICVECGTNIFYLICVNKTTVYNVYLFQFMGVHIYDVLLSITIDGLNIHGTAEEVHADGTAGGPARALVFSANVVKAKVDMWTSESMVLGEVQCSVLIEGTVRAEGPLNVEVCFVSHGRVVIIGDIY